MLIALNNTNPPTRPTPSPHLQVVVAVTDAVVVLVMMVAVMIVALMVEAVMMMVLLLWKTRAGHVVVWN